MSPPPRGFDVSEFQTRCNRAQAMMAEAGLDALLLTTEPDVRYFTGFLTRFWESPTRPWFLVLPRAGAPIAVIPTIGAHLMGQSWISDIRTWRAPDYNDDGVSLLSDTLGSCVDETGRIGTPSGIETHLRMPLSSWSALRDTLCPRQLVEDAGIMRRLRQIKSPHEIAKIRHACGIADRAFVRVPEIAAAGVPLEEIFRRFQMLCLDEGADWVGYLAGGAGPGGYGDVITATVPRPLAPGDVLMLDTGLVWDGYFCDFDRNYAVGKPTADVVSTYAHLIDAAQAGFDLARPGVTAAALFHAMGDNLGGAGDVGRLGHGLGMQVTEGLSLIPDDDTVLEPGMVMTLEPGLTLSAGQTLVHEENIVITEDGAAYLSTPAPKILPELHG